MKGPFGISGPKHRRISMQFGYDVRPSLWQTVKSNSHLVIAAVGTVALVGVAGSALWLAMPDGERRAFAQVEKPAPAPAVTQAADVQPAVNAGQLSGGTETAMAAPAQPAAIGGGVSGSASLSAQDPRWKGAAPKQAAAENKGVMELQKEAGAPPIPTPEQAATVAAYQAAVTPPGDEKATPHAGTDKAETAAIPTPKPTAPEAGDDAAENGHILRAVTMRSGPKKSASALITIPAKAAVQVMTCKSWCQVEYKGQRGWIYKSFLQRG